MSDWETLGAVEPRDLIDVRLQLHWAAQAAAAVGKQLLPHRPDFSEQSLEWLEVSRVLAKAWWPERGPSAPRSDWRAPLCSCSARTGRFCASCLWKGARSMRRTSG